MHKLAQNIVDIKLTNGSNKTLLALSNAKMMNSTIPTTATEELQHWIGQVR
jgi:hypothetical protein